MKHQKTQRTVTFQKGRGLFKICCGKHAGGDGQLRPTIHWLGRDEEHAEYAAFTIRKAWSAMESAGKDRWLPADLAHVRGIIDQGVGMFRDAFANIEQQRRALVERAAFLNGPAAFISPAAAEPEPSAKADAAVPTLYGAIAAYLTSLRAKRVSDGHKERASQILETNLKRTRADCPLADVDFKWLESLADHFRSRPASLKEEGKQISANTVGLFLRYLKAFFVWLDDSGWGDWQGPRKLTKIFRCSVMELMTPTELRESATIQQFSTDDLVKLYQAANPFTRRCMLVALFCGATQMELTVMEKGEFDLDNGTLKHIRNKTRIAGEFWLPPEAVALLKADFAKRPKDKLAFRSPEGMPLVVFKDGKKISDAVRQSWDHLRDNEALAHTLSFKFLRKYLADYCVRYGGEEMGMIAMSHARRSIVAKHYSSARQLELFKAMQRKMHAELKSAGLFDAKKAAAKAA